MKAVLLRLQDIIKPDILVALTTKMQQQFYNVKRNVMFQLVMPVNGLMRLRGTVAGFTDQSVEKI